MKAATQPRPVVRVENLVKEFEVGALAKRAVVHAVNRVSFEIRRQEVLGLVGESGSGKTTVARLIARLYRETSGTIAVNGKPVPKHMNRRELLAYRKRVQVIFQDPFSSLNPLQTVRHILRRPLVVHKLAHGKLLQERIRELLEICGLKPSRSFLDKYPHELSGGQRQRIGIARTLAVNPLLLLADEPTSMLDVSVRLDIMNLLLDLKERRRVSYLFITHDLAGAHYISDRLAIMYAGYLVESGSSDEVINNPLHPYTRLLRQAAPKPELGLKPEQIDVSGEVPDLADLPRGCPFAPRCVSRTTACTKRLPDMIQAGKNRHVRCVLFEK